MMAKLLLTGTNFYIFMWIPFLLHTGLLKLQQCQKLLLKSPLTRATRDALQRLVMRDQTFFMHSILLLIEPQNVRNLSHPVRIRWIKLSN